MAQTIKRALSPRGLVGHLSSYQSRRWEFVRKPLPGGGDLSILLEAVNVVPFSIFHFKKLLLAIVISSHMGGKQSMYRLKSLNKKTFSLCPNE